MEDATMITKHEGIVEQMKQVQDSGASYFKN